jgi:hypothetical protein
VYVLFQVLKLKNNPNHHWSDNSGWDMAEAMERVVLQKTKEVMEAGIFFSLSCDEVTSVDCQSWVCGQRLEAHSNTPYLGESH